MADPRFVFDTNVLWRALLPSDDPIAPICSRRMEAVDDGEIRAYCSALSLVELANVGERTDAALLGGVEATAVAPPCASRRCG